MTNTKKFIFLICFVLASSFLHADYNILDPYIINVEKGLKYLEEKELCYHLKDSVRKNEILNLLLEVRKQEEAFSDKYQVVTSQNSLFFAYQVIAKALYKKMHDREITDFEFLRYPDDSFYKTQIEFFAKYPFLYLTEEQELSADEDDDTEPLNDTLPEISRQLISVNLSMETCLSLDSALFVFIEGKGVAQELMEQDQTKLFIVKFTNILEEMFKTAGLSPEAYKPYIEKLVMAAPTTREGIINQIFLPKDNIHDFLYMSHSGGFFYQENDANIHEVFALYQQERLGTEFQIDSNLQARILAGTLFNEEVKIYRYTLIPQHEQEAYIQLVDEVLNEIFEQEKQGMTHSYASG